MLYTKQLQINHLRGLIELSVNKLICILNTKNVIELASVYSVADIFVNVTYEDYFQTVNLEAQACGTKVITYDTGECRETICN